MFIELTLVRDEAEPKREKAIFNLEHIVGLHVWDKSAPYSEANTEIAVRENYKDTTDLHVVEGYDNIKQQLVLHGLMVNV